MTGALAVLLLIGGARPAAAQLAGQCVGGQCADGFRGCGCDASCCERRLRSKTGGAVGGGYGYGAESATFGLMSSYTRKYFEASSQRAALAREQKRIEELERRAREQQERERREREFRSDRDRLLSEMKGADVADLDKQPELKLDEPAPRRSLDPEEKDAACRRRFPGLEPEASYIPRMAAFEKVCGSNLAGDRIAEAGSTKAAAIIAYESRIHRLLGKGRGMTKDDLWELNRLLDDGEALTRTLSPEERERLLGVPEPSVFDPADTEGARMLEGIRLEDMKMQPPLPTFSPGAAMVDAIERLDAFAKKLPSMPDLDEIHVNVPSMKLPERAKAPKSWKGVGHWIEEKKEQGRQAVSREIAVLAGYGARNESEYGQ